MNFLTIRYFIAIAEEGNISAAARKLYISQQSLSESLKKLESEIGVPLFTRGRRMTLTVAGQCVLASSREMLQIYNTMLTDVDDITHKRRSKITIGIPTWRTPPFLGDLLMRYSEKYPEYEVSVLKRLHTDIAHNMNGVDLYFSDLPLSDDLENHILLDSDPYCVVFQRSLAEKIFPGTWEATEGRLLETQDLALLRKMPFLLLRDRYGQLTEDLHLLFEEYRFDPIVGLNSENSEINNQYCLSGIGCLLAPQSYVNSRFFSQKVNEETVGLLSYPIRTESFSTKLVISHSKGKHLHTAEICFIKEAQEYLQNLQQIL